MKGHYCLERELLNVLTPQAWYSQRQITHYYRHFAYHGERKARQELARYGGQGSMF